MKALQGCARGASWAMIPGHKEHDGMKTRIAMRGWLGWMALGAVLVAPQALAQTCSEKCSLNAGSKLIACAKKCPPGKPACTEACTREVKFEQAKCNKKCPKSKGKSKPQPHSHDDGHDHDE
ncbi:hypothetical protein D7X55_10685 [Corallococcus sp. AB049A]|uniref:Uncharacterized protein n=2 Tax=Myxococcaceae TaxID=31 RepID=A0A3A8QN75_9BACT|nr:hypothetical protein D7Y23_23875 [Corallococcus sp. AB050B]RKH68330.1 hypothetical protein D7X96_17610 [Corallococcus interemptor]RKI69945.1 hypothetical protein D7X55_10685 [Corallococcus sp. AB049A]